MSNIDKLLQKSSYNQLLITNTKMIQYFTSNFYEVGERFIGLAIRENLQPVLILNSLFMKPKGIDVLYYKDGDSITNIIQSIFHDKTLGVDGTMQASFLIPLIDKYSIVDISPLLHSIRNIKDVDEQKKMINASFQNDAVMTSLTKHFQVGITEIELANIALKMQSTHPMTGPSFEPIVLFGENSWDPHGVPSNRKLQDGDMILVDMGGMVEGYASDMTRCFFTSENSKLKEIYEIVLQANLAAIEKVSVGLPLKDVDKAARDIIANAGYGDYFVHRTGHGIGIEAHETLDVSSVNETIIEEGMCFSIEPGIYIEGLGGVRIEDLVLVRDGKALVLNQYPKEIKIINV